MPADERPARDRFDVQVDASACDVQVVSVRGELDLYTAERFTAGLRTAVQGGRGPVVVDLCSVPFMDSTGLHLLLNLLRRLTRQRRRLVVSCAPGGIQRLFELTRMDGTFDLYDSREGALAALRAGAQQAQGA